MSTSLFNISQAETEPFHSAQFGVKNHDSGIAWGTMFSVSSSSNVNCFNTSWTDKDKAFAQSDKSNYTQSYLTLRWGASGNKLRPLSRTVIYIIKY